MGRLLEEIKEHVKNPNKETPRLNDLTIAMAELDLTLEQRKSFGVEIDQDGYIPYFGLNNAFDIWLDLTDAQRQKDLAELIYISLMRLPEYPVSSKGGSRQIISEKRQDMLHDAVFLQKYPTKKQTNQQESQTDIKEAIAEARLNQITEAGINLKTLMESDIPEPEWLIEKIITFHGICIFGGDSGHGKSFIAQHVALACSMGKPVLDQFDTKPVSVLYIDEEGTLPMLKQRFTLLCNGEQTKIFPENLNILSRQDLKFNDDIRDYKHQGENAALIKRVIEHYNPGLVIVDSMVGCMVGSENDADNVRGIFNTLKPLLRDREMGVILLHHTSKGGRIKSKASLRGSGDFVAFADTLLMFNKKNDLITISWEKTRMLPESQTETFSVLLKQENNGVLIRYLGAPKYQETAIDECINHIEEWVKAENITDFKTGELSAYIMNDKGYSKDIMYAALNKMIDDDMILKLGQKGKYRVRQEVQIENIE